LGRLLERQALHAPDAALAEGFRAHDFQPRRASERPGRLDGAQQVA
jgi:hypothetical protein